MLAIYPSSFNIADERGKGKLRRALSVTHVKAAGSAPDHGRRRNRGHDAAMPGRLIEIIS